MHSESKTFCILPFVHLYTEPNGEVKPCCIANGFDDKLNLKKMSIDGAFNSEQMKELRRDMLSGVQNKVCQVCYKKEEDTGHSPRLNFNDNPLWTLPEVDYDFSVTSQFQHLDVRFSNLCNFKCRMCNHNFSSNWYEDYGKIRDDFQLEKENIPKILKVSNTIAQDLKSHLSDIRSIYFAGGEPLIMPEHFEVLKYLYDTMKVEQFQLSSTDFFNARRLSIHYNTNLSVIKYDEHDLIDLWRGFYKVFLSISCDGVHEVGEYQRTGFNTKRFEENLNTVRKYANPRNVFEQNHGINYNFQYTTTIWNVYHIFDFIKFMIENKFINSSEHIDFYYAWVPNSVSLNNISQTEKIKLIQFLENGTKSLDNEKTINEITNIINFIKSETSSEKSVEETVKFTNDLDLIQNTDVGSINGIDFKNMLN